MNRRTEIKRKIDQARTWRTLNLYMTFFWLAMIPVALILGWLRETTFVSILSLVALVLASQSSWQASRAEEKTEQLDIEKKDK